MRTLLYICYNLTSLLNGINSRRRYINESSIFFVVAVHRHLCHRLQPPSSKAAVLIIGRHPCCHLPSSTAWGFRSPVGYQVTAFFPRNFTRIWSRTPTFYLVGALCTAHLDRLLASAAVVTAVNVDTAVGGSLCWVPPLTNYICCLHCLRSLA